MSSISTQQILVIYTFTLKLLIMIEIIIIRENVTFHIARESKIRLDYKL